MDSERTASDLRLILALTFAFAAMTGIRTLSSLLGLAAAAAAGVWMSTRGVHDPILADDRDAPRLLLIPIVVGAAMIVLSTGTAFVMVQSAAFVAIVLSLGLLAFARNHRCAVIGVTIGLLLVLAGTSLWVTNRFADSEIDIILAHEEGAQALLDGENPYEVVDFTNTSGYKNPGPFVGYPYPPVSLLAYAGGSILFEPVAVATFYLAILIVALALSGWPVNRLRSSVAVAALVAGTPALGFMLYSASTEGFTSLLFLGSGLTWKKRPVVSAILLGLALSSKQYLIIPALALVLADVDQRVLRIVVASTAAIAVALPFFFWGPEAFIEAFRVANSGWAFRPDSISLGGLGVALPSAVVSLVAVTAMWVSRKRFSGPSSFFWLASTGLIVMLVAHPHSLINHWFGLMALVAVAIVVNWREAESGRGTHLSDADIAQADR